MKLPLKEPLYPSYIYIDAQNTVHIFMPVVSGTSIGLDNTCKSVYAMKEFFGKGDVRTNPNTIKKVLVDYRNALEDDLHWVGINDALAQQKRERLAQITTYLKVVERLEQSKELDTLKPLSARYPRPLEVMLQDRERSNLHSMILRPTTQDAYLRAEAARPFFSVAHDSESCQRFETTSALQQALITVYQALHFSVQNVKSQLFERVLAKPFDHSNFELLKTHLDEEAKALLGPGIDFNKDSFGHVVDKTYLDEVILLGDPLTPEMYLDSLFDACAPGFLETYMESPFNRLTRPEQWSIATQFLLGITSFYAVTQFRMSSDVNWGRLLDDNPELSQSLAQTMAAAQQSKQSPEEALLHWINTQSDQFGLNAPLSTNDIQAIKHDFAQRYVQIQESPHFDEFFLLNAQNKGAFVVHQGSMCASLAEFASSSLFDLPPDLYAFLERTCKAMKSLDAIEIPHQNPWVQTSIELDLSSMDSPQLQALYDQITTYKDPALKKHLLQEFKQERPDFKPQIDAKQFLQRVAYGEQDQAEALLKEDADRAQELLRISRISFTDYSGRTFTCSAYEYAYWAKDTHMQRMLEKYMDANTGVVMLKRVQAMEELILGPGLFKEPRGLVYTQKGKEYRSVHFDLNPLKNALKEYIQAYDEIAKETDTDWEVLDKIWLKVGLAQREVPAHIAHEYCHPNRSFEDISNNLNLLDASRPENLTRQLKFYLNGIHSYDFWFSPNSYSIDSGLGFPFVIVRAMRGAAVRMRGGGRVASLDLAAIEAIEKVRTEDLKQSIVNLELSLSLHATLSYNDVSQSSTAP
ncbi:SidC [Legionella saoudiensis]|uniref:SidC n=1 Tax=Legionella saoudiensis TaxID=1750561 RepID=UPI000A42DE2A|nr:SidC [Legionella saoudiensis]